MRAGGKVADSNGDIVEMDKNQFFLDRKLTDGLNYFYASYNSTTNTYDFGNIRGFITNIIQKKSQWRKHRKRLSHRFRSHSCPSYAFYNDQ